MLRDAAGSPVELPVTRSDDYLAAIPPLTVRLRPGGTAFVLVAKYRCDLGDAQVASTALVGLPAGGPSLSVQVRSSDLARCRGPRQGPGQAIAVSPFVPRLRRLLAGPRG